MHGQFEVFNGRRRLPAQSYLFSVASEEALVVGVEVCYPSNFLSGSRVLVVPEQDHHGRSWNRAFVLEGIVAHDSGFSRSVPRSEIPGSCNPGNGVDHSGRENAVQHFYQDCNQRPHVTTRCDELNHCMRLEHVEVGRQGFSLEVQCLMRGF
ncbi:hypothetical protein D3C81_1173520 [compost metagenome]